MSNYEEEYFGILSDDEIYLDCLMLKPSGLPDDRLETLHIWVPRYPLNKSSTIVCARHEARWLGSDSTDAHLLFDLRGTGESDGKPGDRRFNIDLKSIEAWAEERFGKIDLLFLGAPDGHGQAQQLPIRPGVIMELYQYTAADRGTGQPVIYLSTFGNFSVVDDALCAQLAQAGYEVYGLDPLRYLLHASSRERLAPNKLWQDFETLCKVLDLNPIVIGQPLAAGIALMWTANVDRVSGVIAIGEAQKAFDQVNIFDASKAHSYFLSRQVYRIAPRPSVFVLDQKHPLGGNTNEMAAFYSSTGHPRRAEKVKEISPAFLARMLAWIERKNAEAAAEASG